MSDINTIYQDLLGKIADTNDRINSLTKSLTVTGPIKGDSLQSVGVIKGVYIESTSILKGSSIEATNRVKCLDLSTNSFPSVENSLTTIQSTIDSLNPVILDLVQRNALVSSTVGNISSTPSSTIVTGDLILEDTFSVKATNSRVSAIYTSNYDSLTGGGFVISHPIIITRLHIQANHWATDFSERTFTMFSTKYSPEKLWEQSISRTNLVDGDYVKEIAPQYLSAGSYLFLIDRRKGQLTSQGSNDTPIFPQVPFTRVYGIDLETNSMKNIYVPPSFKRIWYIGNFSYHAPPTLLADTIGNESKPVQTLYVKKINGLNLYPGIFMLTNNGNALSFVDTPDNNKPRDILSGSTGSGTLSLQIGKFYPEISLYELEAIGTLRGNFYDQILEITVFHGQLQIGYIIFFLLASDFKYPTLAVSEFKIKVTVGITRLGTRGKIYSSTEFCNIKHNYAGSDDVNYKYFTSRIIETTFDSTIPNLSTPLSVTIKDVTKVNKSVLNSVFQTSQCILKRIY